MIISHKTIQVHNGISLQANQHRVNIKGRFRTGTGCQYLLVCLGTVPSWDLNLSIDVWSIFIFTIIWRSQKHQLSNSTTSPVIFRCIVGRMTNSGMLLRCGSVAMSRIAAEVSSTSTINVRASSSGGIGRLSKIGVATSPGTTTLARIPVFLKSALRNSVKLITPAFAAP